jgi:hypothetical protein
VAALRIRFCDEHESGFGWVVVEFMERCSHALVAAGRVWVIDPVDGEGVAERIRAAGEPAGVIQLLDRHNRDCAAIASELDVPLLRVPERLDAPFEVVRVVNTPVWRERALWWPERRVLVTADALGSVGYFTLGRGGLGVHPLLRPFRPRLVQRFDPDLVLVGHGEGVTLRETAG